MTLRFPVCIAVLALLAVPATAPAAPPRSAQAFASAAERLSTAVTLHLPEIERQLKAADFGQCDEALLKRPVPRRAQRRFGYTIALALLQPIFGPILPPLRQFVADLEAVVTHDPILQSGRAAWRDGVATLSRLPSLDRPCEQLERWSASGFAADKAPAFSLRDMRVLLDEDANGEDERKLDRAVRRLRQLGIPRAAARRFDGERLLDGIDDGDFPGLFGTGEGSSSSEPLR